MQMKNLIVLLCNLILLGCSFDEFSYAKEEKEEKVEIIQLIVEPKVEIRNTYGVDSLPCIIVKEGNERYALPRNWIKDFEYEEGYEYMLKVKRVTPPYIIYDAPGSFYYLLEVISKKQQETTPSLY